MEDSELRKIFPNLTPGTSAPAMFRLNGCGLALYGSRDRHEESNTYVSTYCISLVFIPIIALKAYRISDAPNGGWYFLGTEPLSTFAKTWNALLASFIMAVIAAGVYDAHTSSPEYRAKVNMAEAIELREEGKLEKAAEQYKLVFISSAPQKKEGLEGLKELVQMGLKKGDALLAAKLFRIQVSAEKYRYIGTQRRKELWAEAVAYLDGTIGNDLEATRHLLKTVKDIAPLPKDFEEQQLKLLERTVQNSPNSIAAVTELTTILDKKGQTERCIRLLEPLANKLGITDGARILGTYYLNQGNEEKALPIIEPYVTAMAKEVSKTNQKYSDMFKVAFDQKKRWLTTGRAYGFDYKKYKSSDKKTKAALVNKYMFTSIANDSVLKKAREAYNKACKAVPIALREAEIRCNQNDFKRADFILTNIESAAKRKELYKQLRKKTSTALGK